MRKSLMSIKTYKECYDKKKDLSFKLSAIEGRRVSIPEVDRRILNIPNISLVLSNDAEIKRRLKL